MHVPTSSPPTGATLPPERAALATRLAWNSRAQADAARSTARARGVRPDDASWVAGIAAFERADDALRRGELADAASDFGLAAGAFLRATAAPPGAGVVSMPAPVVGEPTVRRGPAASPVASTGEAIAPPGVARRRASIPHPAIEVFLPPAASTSAPRPARQPIDYPVPPPRGGLPRRRPSTVLLCAAVAIASLLELDRRAPGSPAVAPAANAAVVAEPMAPVAPAPIVAAPEPAPPPSPLEVATTPAPPTIEGARPAAAAAPAVEMGRPAEPTATPPRRTRTSAPARETAPSASEPEPASGTILASHDPRPRVRLIPEPALVPSIPLGPPAPPPVADAPLNEWFRRYVIAWGSLDTATLERLGVTVSPIEHQRLDTLRGRRELVRATVGNVATQTDGERTIVAFDRVLVHRDGRRERDRVGYVLQPGRGGLVAVEAHVDDRG